MVSPHIKFCVHRWVSNMQWFVQIQVVSRNPPTTECYTCILKITQQKQTWNVEGAKHVDPECTIFKWKCILIMF